MNTGTSEPKREPGAASSANVNANVNASASGEAKEASGALLVQQQLQLLQMQQQQLASMSPSELATMSQQMALFMMPMMPFMMPLNQAMGGAGASTAAGGATAAGSAADSPASAPATGFAGQDDALALLNGAPFGNLEEAPKRKRGRPPKKDVAARAKADAEKTLKQFPMWGYGLPMPMLPGFPNVLAQGLPGAGKNEDGSDAQAADDEHKDIVGVVADAALEKLNAEAGKPPKKKSRGTGKPRGRPRTRPRPGEIIHRPKPPAIAPANYSVMYNYSLSNLAQKPEDVAAGAGTPTSHDDSRLASLGASLLPGEHE